MKTLLEAKELSVLYHFQQELMPLESNVVRVKMYNMDDSYKLTWSDIHKSFSASFEMDGFKRDSKDNLLSCQLVVKNLSCISLRNGPMPKPTPPFELIMRRDKVLDSSTDEAIENSCLMIKRSIVICCVASFLRALYSGSETADICYELLKDQRMVDILCQAINDKKLELELCEKHRAAEYKRRKASRGIKILHEHKTTHSVYFLFLKP